MKTLIIQTRPGIGDLCVFLPAIHEICLNNVNSKVDLLTKERTCAKETLEPVSYTHLTLPTKRIV